MENEKKQTYEMFKKTINNIVEPQLTYLTQEINKKNIPNYKIICNFMEHVNEMNKSYDSSKEIQNNIDAIKTYDKINVNVEKMKNDLKSNIENVLNENKINNIKLDYNQFIKFYKIMNAAGINDSWTAISQSEIDKKIANYKSQGD